MPEFSGKRILVTGASSGIGLATAKAILKEGGRVVALSRSLERIEKAFQDEPNSSVQAIAHDVKMLDAIEDLVEKIGALDGIVHSAGDARLYPLRGISPKNLEDVFSLHLYGPLLLTTNFQKQNYLLPESSVVFIGSIASIQPVRGHIAYCMAKSSLSMLVRGLTNESDAKKRIRFNCIMPGHVQTPMLDQTIRTLGADRLNEMNAHVPLGLGQSRNIADLILFLLSKKSEWMTGSSILIDGGMASIS